MRDDLIERVVRRVVDAIESRTPGASVPVPVPALSPATSQRPSTVPAPWPPKRVALGGDHGGFAMKEELVRYLQAKGFAVVDCGTRSRDSVDYPDFAKAVAEEVASGKCDAGIVIDGAGIGSAMAANKVHGVRCAVCHDVDTILNSREHNDANVLSMGSGIVSTSLARRMVSLWLSTECTGERHLRRVRKIMEIEE